MRLSKYNIWAERKGEEFVYNGLSGGLMRLPSGATDAIKKFDLSDRVLKESLLSELVRAGVLIADSVDEISLLEKRFNFGKVSASHLSLTIITSLACNFDCPYCYEDKSAKSISDEVCNKILEYVRDMLHKSVRKLTIHWLGGEPLLAKHKIVQLSDSFKQICAERDVEYNAYITTNGSLLTKQVAQELVRLGVRRAQVTLDGPAEIHDRMRPTRKGKGTFDKVLNNIKSVVDDIKVVVRVNVDKENFGFLEDLLKILAAEGLAGKIEIYVGHLMAVDDGVNQPSARYTSPCFTTREFAPTEKRFNDMAVQYGFRSRVLDGPVLTPCLAMRLNEYVIGCEGEIYKCWKSVGNQNEVIGNIRDYRNLNSRVSRWLGYTPFNDDECVNCIALPVCMGGCAHHAMDKKLFGDRCSTFRYEHRERVIQFIDHLYAHSEASAVPASAGKRPVAV